MRARGAYLLTLVRCRWLPLVALAALGVVLSGLTAHRARAAWSTDTSGALVRSEPVGAHAMLYLNTPFSAMKAMFAQAADMGASEIRVDIELSAVFPRPRLVRSRPGRRSGPLSRRVPPRLNPLDRQTGFSDALPRPAWGRVDEYLRLARRYHLRVLAVLTATPYFMADCPPGIRQSETYRCPPRSARQWGRAVGEIAAHVRGAIDDFEILNEPDGWWSFVGSPEQYARLLSASYRAVHRADPAGRVVLGGLMHTGSAGRRWMNAMLATPGSDAGHSFDVANIHLRVPPWQVAPRVSRWRAYFSRHGFPGPLWVTETGYPAARSEQHDAGYEGGPVAQASWLATVIPRMLANGAAKVFVTERDIHGGPYASEGVLRTPDPLPPFPRVRRRPSFYAVQTLARTFSGS